MTTPLQELLDQFPTHVTLAFAHSDRVDDVADRLAPITGPVRTAWHWVFRRPLVWRAQAFLRGLVRRVLRLPSEQDMDPSPVYRRVGVGFQFSETGFGFGEFYISRDADGQHYIDTEHMGPEQIKRYLCSVVDSAILDTEQDPIKHRKYHAHRGGWCHLCEEKQ